MKFKHTFNLDLEIIVDVIDYTPARPAPSCSNPSDPAYSDSGDPEEIDFVLYLEDSAGNIQVVPDSLSILYENLLNDILSEVRDRQ